MFAAVRCYYFTSGITFFCFFFPFERGAHVGMHAHTHTRGHYFDIAETIAIV